jgi:hypothetical protein
MTQITKKITGLAVSLALAAAVLSPVAALAQGDLTIEDTGVTAIEESGLKLSGGDVRQTAARLINVALGFLGIVAVVIVIIGGFQYMLSGGNEEKTSAARKLMISGIIGLAIILSAWAITTFVLSRLIEATAD